jgi:hypothetical protein
LEKLFRSNIDSIKKLEISDRNKVVAAKDKRKAELSQAA